jgi:tetratricopeptide (TPR) repeat protein
LPEAIEFYSKAIQEHDQDPVFYSNSKILPLTPSGATCYYDLQEFDKCLSDCNRAMELNPLFLKVIPTYISFHQAYYRKAQALHEMLKEEEAMAVLKEGLEKEPENE